jgi:valyl-tRNA synthetase
VIDPLSLIDEYGADALRFTLAAMAAQGRDIKLATSRVEGYRNFATKLWNAARFCEMNECAVADGYDPAAVGLTVDQWIVGEAERTGIAVTTAIEQHRYNEAAGALYHFIWHVFCDWYLELIKPVLNGDDVDARAEARSTAAWVFDRILAMLHPFMPFITEELWSRAGAREQMLINAAWPEPSGLQKETADREIEWIIRMVNEIRSVRAEMNVPAGARIPLSVCSASDETRARVAAWDDNLKQMARLDKIDFADAVPAGAVQVVLDEAILALPLAGIIDFAAEAQRLEKEISKIGGEIGKLEAKLGNDNFISRAPEHVVEEQRDRKVEAEQVRDRLTSALRRLKGAA